MKDLSKEEKKTALKKYKESDKAELLLTREKVIELFDYLEKQLEKAPCDHSRKYTEYWLRSNISENIQGAVLEEIKHMGGYCDCEVLLNCYENYDI